MMEARARSFLAANPGNASFNLVSHSTPSPGPITQYRHCQPWPNFKPATHTCAQIVVVCVVMMVRYTARTRWGARSLEDPGWDLERDQRIPTGVSMVKQVGNRCQA